MSASMMMLLLASAPDEDDEKTATRNILTRILERSSLELTYWFNTESYLALGGMQLPLVGLLNDTLKVFTNISKETWALATDNEELSEKTKTLQSVSKITYGWNSVDKFIKQIEL